MVQLAFDVTWMGGLLKWFSCFENPCFYDYSLLRVSTGLVSAAFII